MPQINLDHASLLLIFVGITAIAFLFQALLLLGVLLAVRKGMNSIRQELGELRASVTPLILSSQKLIDQVVPSVESAASQIRRTLERVGPKLESTMDDLSGIASVLRVESEQMQETALEIMQRVRTQSGRIDEMTTALLDRLFHFGETLSEFVSKPLRHVQGFTEAVKSALESLNAAVPPRPRPEGRPDPNHPA